MKIPALVYLAAFTGFFFVRNILMPLSHDDYVYAFIWDGDDGGNLYTKNENRYRVESLGDLIKSQWEHYFTWGGRVIAHSLAQFFIWIGKPYFDVANTVIFFGVVLLMIRLSGAALEKSKFAVVWICVNLLFVIPCPIANELCLTFACNYLWMSFLQLAFLFPYVRDFRAGIFKGSTTKVLAMTLPGILAGWSNEAGAGATLCLTALLLWKIQSPPRYLWAGFFALIIGFALNILAPGNFSRLEIAHPNFQYTAAVFIEHLNAFIPIFVADLFVLIPAIFYFAKHRPTFDKDEILILSFSVASFMVVSAMMFSPTFNLYTSITSNIFALTAASCAISKIKKLSLQPKLSPATKKALTVGSFLIVILYSSAVLYTDFSLNRAVNEQVAYIQQHKDEDPIVLPPLNNSRVFDKILGMNVADAFVTHIGGINADPKFCYNLWLAKYYGAKHVVAGER